MSPRRRKPPSKVRYRVTNWPEYDRALVRRGGLTIGFDEAFYRNHWRPAPTGQRCAVPVLGHGHSSVVDAEGGLRSALSDGRRAGGFDHPVDGPDGVDSRPYPVVASGENPDGGDSRRSRRGPHRRGGSIPPAKVRGEGGKSAGMAPETAHLAQRSGG